ncbi:sigma-70 family RNA polymerase sigma factor [Chitinophaga sp. 22620]|uniref:sigma-70 family RNA polymerase sigma factor n=1 Tax=Chitinophaga sp. 22620 TaxID=3453952 RepID=UPI003F82826A
MMRTDPTHIDLSQPSDETLLEQLRKGNMRAFNTLFERHSRRGVELATMIAGNRFEAEEIVSDVFFSFWARREKLPPIPLFQAYLFTAIRYRAKTIAQLNKTVQVVPLDDYASRPQDSPVDPLRQLASGELAGILHKAIEQLPAQRKLVFKLSRIDGLSYKTMASLLNISESTVKNQLAAALKTLRNSLSAYPLALPMLLWPCLPFSF